ncbi:MAG TPA: DUF3037 domain-containing protein [Chitinophagaceae bacterium]
MRYVHDQVTGEFVNVGIVIYCPEEGLLEAKVISRFSRISNFFEEINGYQLLSSLKHFQKEIESVKNEIGFFHSASESRSLKTLTNDILIRDDSALQLSEEKVGMDLKIEYAVNDLFYRLVEKYNSEPAAELKTDSHAWAKVYKSHFDRYGITPRLKEHTVNTNTDKITFDKAWKNGAWHCYQSLEFDLKKEDTIKNKVYKWFGIVKALQTSNEKLNLYFLTTSPQNNPQLEPFILKTLSQKSDNLTVTIVKQEEADQFAFRLKKEIETSLNDGF